MREDQYMDMDVTKVDRRYASAVYTRDRMKVKLREISELAVESGWQDWLLESYLHVSESYAEAVETLQVIDLAREKRGGWTRFWITDGGSKVHSRESCSALARAHSPALMPEFSGLPAFMFSWPGGSHLCHYCRCAEKRARAQR